MELLELNLVLGSCARLLLKKRVLIKSQSCLGMI